MTDRPMLFKAPMVRALLDGTKTQTRQVLKIPTKGEYVRQDIGGWEASVIGGNGVIDSNGKNFAQRPCVWNQTTGTVVSPKYMIGDRFWVQESWHTAADYDHLAPRDLPDDAPLKYKADRSYFGHWHRGSGRSLDGRIRQSIFMQKRFSRLTLNVTNVRVERLQDITEANAKAEGCKHPLADTALGDFPESGPGTYIADEQTTFARLWNSINGSNAWRANPWVTAITFDVAQRNIDQ